MSIGVDRSVDVLVLGDGNGKGGNVENFELSALEFRLRLFDSLSGTGGGSLLVDVGQSNGSGSDRTGPVCVDLLAVLDAVDDVLKVGLPVDPGGDDEGIRA